MNRQAFKAAKELEEARKAGTAPPAVDSEGKIINPHIPEYITRAPWYVGEDGPSLKHQRNHNEKKRNFDSLEKWLPRAQFCGPAATKYRAGACENCGAMTHSAKSCLERPRRRGAKLTGRSIRPDEVSDSVNLNFEGKRDRWNGYDVGNFHRVQERFSKLEAARKAVKAEKLDSVLRNGKSSTGQDSDDDTGAMAEGAVVQETGSASKTAVRNLRIREDTAKYLYNLDLNSAYYDPKSRSMRADPRPDLDQDDKDFLGDNFVRQSDDVTTLAQMNLHAIKAGAAGRTLPHLQAEPSRAEAVFKEFEARKTEIQHKTTAKILEKYGANSNSRPDDALSGVQQTETYIEYNNEGKILNNVKELMPASRYPEDILEKNHTSVWGSYFCDGKWGYSCCRQLLRKAVCTGEAGRQAAIETQREMEERTSKSMSKRNKDPLFVQWRDSERSLQEAKQKSESESSQDLQSTIQHKSEAPHIEGKEQNAR